jgi:hypothetical protein
VSNLMAVWSTAPLATCSTWRGPLSAALHACAIVRMQSSISARAQEALRVLPDAVLDEPPRAPKAQGFAIGALPPPPPQLAAPAGGAAAPAAAHASPSALAAAEPAARGEGAAAAPSAVAEQAPVWGPACAAGMLRDTCASEAAGLQPVASGQTRGAAAGPEAGRAPAACVAKPSAGEGPSAAAARANPRELAATRGAEANAAGGAAGGAAPRDAEVALGSGQAGELSDQHAVAPGKRQRVAAC